MENSTEAVISRIKDAFPRGDLKKYLETNPQPDKARLVKFLEGIKAGKCPDNNTETSKVKAHALLVLLKLTD
jgi:hypothetical protein